jgi:midasin (ATPase involved in ribosome maturation)
MEGFLVLAERSRNEEDKNFIRRTIERTIGFKIDENLYYETYFSTNLKA